MWSRTAQTAGVKELTDFVVRAADFTTLCMKRREP